MATDIFQIVVEALAAVIAILVARYLIPFIQNKIGVQNANTFVKAVEQMYKDFDGERKLEMVTLKLSQELAKHGINYTDEQIRDLIESAVKQMKIEMNKEVKA